MLAKLEKLQGTKRKGLQDPQGNMIFPVQVRVMAEKLRAGI